jgi:hypothetical protein
MCSLDPRTEGHPRPPPGGGKTELNSEEKKVEEEAEGHWATRRARGVRTMRMCGLDGRSEVNTDLLA